MFGFKKTLSKEFMNYAKNTLGKDTKQIVKIEDNESISLGFLESEDKTIQIEFKKDCGKENNIVSFSCEYINIKSFDRKTMIEINKKNTSENNKFNMLTLYDFRDKPELNIEGLTVISTDKKCQDLKDLLRYIVETSRLSDELVKTYFL